MVRAWLRSRTARVLVGLAIGAGVGTAFFYAQRLQGVGLFVLVGAVAGAVAAVIEHGYRRNAQLAEVVVSVPQLSELRFVVTKDSRQVAWKLFVETATRVSTQPLEERTGLVREALTSLYGLFQVVREILKDTMPSATQQRAPTVEQMAVTMLNLELRPFLSRWHPELRAWEEANPGADESGWPASTACRRELVGVQGRIREYAFGFATLAGMDDATTLLASANPGPADHGTDPGQDVTT